MVLITCMLDLLTRVAMRAAGYRPDETFGSCMRRAFSHIAVLMTLIFATEAAFALSGEEAEALDGLTVRIGVLLSFLFFVSVVIIPALVLIGKDIVLNPNRLLLDIAISGAFSIFAFALIYRKFGIEPSATDMELRPILDSIYFSAVTFSTLGFGDFRPNADIRGYAAIQGLWGNLHLGLLAGTIFYSIQKAERERGNG